MPPRRSAGLVVYRRADPGVVEILLVHPGGPYWSGKDEHAWSIPKGEYGEDDDPEATAAREFQEELGVAPPPGPRIDLGEVQQAGGKRVRAWAVAGDVDPTVVTSNTFPLEWPPGSGTIREFPEVDEAAWYDLATARAKLHTGQVPLVDALASALGAGRGEP